MGSKLIFLVVLCVVCVNCDDFFRRAYKMANIRAKRAKYYSSPPMRFYRKPPNTYPIKGPFSYTPPPNYKEHEDTYPGIFRPKVVSPSNHHPSPPSSPPYGPPSYTSSSSTSQLVSSPSAAAIKAPKLEPAPPASEARAQSDAHLKATQIWTHKSRGTAYTLHDDGTLSLEKSEKPKPVYGP